MENFADYDKNLLFEVLKNYHKQFRDAIRIASGLKTNPDYKNINKILIIGMGGSAIGGEILKSILIGYNLIDKLVVEVSRDYDIPNWVDENTLVIASSYSGNTEETLEAFDKAKELTNMTACITSGGKLMNIAEENNSDVLLMPTGFQPRCALPYSLTILMHYLVKLDLFEMDRTEKLLADFNRLPDFIESQAQTFIKPKVNYAKDIANDLKDKIAVFYSSDKILGSINIRCRGQLHENSKAVAFGSILPEMNHNEINSFSNPSDITNNIFYIFLEDKTDHPRIQKRIDAMIDIIKIKDRSIRIKSKEESLLLRIFDILYLFDWVSYYLAENYNEDPIAIPLIIRLKAELNN
jgi:glucose/mannose-6-phosphate isomerase